MKWHLTTASVAIALAAGGHLSPEHPVNNRKVQQCQQHTDTPPDQSDMQSVRARECFFDGDVHGRIVARRQQAGVKTNRRADQHDGEIRAGGSECLAVASFTREYDDSDQRENHDQWDREGDWKGTIVIEGVFADRY